MALEGGVAGRRVDGAINRGSVGTMCSLFILFILRAHVTILLLGISISLFGLFFLLNDGPPYPQFLLSNIYIYFISFLGT